MSPPPPVAYVRDLLSGFAVPWFLCGGWAADAWLGRQTREHADVDIAVFHSDQRAIFEHFPGWALVGHDPHVADDTTEQWNGRQLDLPAHIHVPARESVLATSMTLTHSAHEFEFLLNARSGDDWVLQAELPVTVAMDRCPRDPAWGLPVAPLEVVLYYKSGSQRPQDKQDFVSLLPVLTTAQRSWLRRTLAQGQPQHPWLSRL